MIRAQIVGATGYGGLGMTELLSRHPEMFPPTYVSLVAAAEEGGFLPQVLQQLREMDEKNSRMRAAIVSALSASAGVIIDAGGEKT